MSQQQEVSSQGRSKACAITLTIIALVLVLGALVVIYVVYEIVNSLNSV